MINIDDKTIVKVTNRDNGHVGYKIPDMNNLVRDFNANETKNITMEELRKLAFIPGGPTLIRDYLVIDNKDIVAQLLGRVEPEYYYTEEDIKKLLSPEYSLDALKDCLEFAPKGTIDLVKKIAVEMPLNDVSKRKAILEMTGFDVTAAIMVNEETKEDNEEVKRVRRINEPEILTETKNSGRRTATPVFNDDKYKISK